jgi:hypothetical protein
MALLEIYWPWIISKSSYYIRRPISLCRTILFDTDFQSCSIQAFLNAFAYPIRVAQIINARSSSHSGLAYLLKGMVLTPHVVMPWSWRMWPKANLTNGDLKTCTFIVTWSWTLRPYSQIDGRSNLPGSMVTLWCAWKCHTKLYLAI